MMLLDYFWVFGCIYAKRDEISKIWAMSRVLSCGVGIPRSSVGPRQGVACPHCSVAKKEDLASLKYAAVKVYAVAKVYAAAKVYTAA